jgi:hypothetical protein
MVVASDFHLLKKIPKYPQSCATYDSIALLGKQPDGFSPPGRSEADMATSRTAQLTDFTQDILGRYMCNGFDEAIDSMHNNSPRMWV